MKTYPNQTAKDEAIKAQQKVVDNTPSQDAKDTLAEIKSATINN